VSEPSLLDPFVPTMHGSMKELMFGMSGSIRSLPLTVLYCVVLRALRRLSDGIRSLPLTIL
jgi:hypothetical protein